MAALASAHCAIAAAPDAKQLYATHCAACHGPEGQGDGPAAVWLYPKPRNFASGLFKIKSTPPDSLPSDEDLLQTITRGMPGSSMPSFTYLTEPERRAAVQYVKQLTTRTDESGKRVNLFEEAKTKSQLAPPIPVPPEPPITLQTLTGGKQVYTRLKCFVCHGETGEGTGPSAPTLKDVWGFSLPPRDFNTGAFRGGHTGRDLFLRTATGLAGTPMPAFGGDQLSDGERW
jgi:cytochrome c oxidase cbb3-type subunit 2